MRPRDYIQEYQYDLGTAGTHSIDLDFADPITALLLRFAATNGATSNVGSPIERCISKIEIIDGGQVLYDCPADVILGHRVGLHGRLDYGDYSEAANATPDLDIVIPFGRYLYDQMFAFMPVAHRNPQLRVTFDEATVNAAGATGFVSDSWTLTTVARIMERAATPTGFLSLKEVESFTTAASGDQRIAIPRDRVIRSFVLRAYEAGINPFASLTNIELNCDGGAFVPFDLYGAEYRAAVESILPQAHYGATYYMTDDTAHEVWLSDIQMVSAVTAADDEIVAITAFGNGQATPTLMDAAGAQVAAGIVKLDARGYGVQNVFPYVFGSLDNPELWFDARAFNKIDCFLTQGNAGAEVNVALEQVYPY